jgi:UDP-N-acetylmuramoyl-tripeptide--D-alanyl-D-alanine ligase
MNHPGEIAGLAAMAQPTVAVVNNAQREHLEFMATVEAVARENGAVLQALPATGVAVFPADDAYADVWRSLAGTRRALTFAGAGAADVTATAQWAYGGWAVQAQTPAGPLAFALHIAGRHNVKNAQAAIACALAAGVPLEAVGRGLAAFEPVKGRSRAFQVQLPLALGGQSVTVVDDTYNANPDSVRAAIDVLADLPGPRLLVLGDMGEVGDQGPAFHAEIGGYARERGIETLLTLGDSAQGMGGQHFADIDSLNTAVRGALPGAQSVLVKGSRFMKMERVVEAITAATPHKNNKEQPDVA